MISMIPSSRPCSLTKNASSVYSVYTTSPKIMENYVSMFFKSISMWLPLKCEHPTGGTQPSTAHHDPPYNTEMIFTGVPTGVPTSQRFFKANIPRNVTTTGRSPTLIRSLLGHSKPNEHSLPCIAHKAAYNIQSVSDYQAIQTQTAMKVLLATKLYFIYLQIDQCRLHRCTVMPPNQAHNLLVNY